MHGVVLLKVSPRDALRQKTFHEEPHLGGPLAKSMESRGCGTYVKMEPFVLLVFIFTALFASKPDISSSQNVVVFGV